MNRVLKAIGRWFIAKDGEHALLVWVAGGLILAAVLWSLS
tara:strand:- start:26535 stop:26654 length:120 start_codon:yes stop_codon:yes gene_type:complete